MSKEEYKNTFALIIGVGQRAEIDPEALQTTQTDAERLNETLVNHVGYHPENTKLLLGADASKDNITHQLSELKGKTSAQKADMILVFFSGHGVKRKTESINEYYLIPHDASNQDYIQKAIRGSEFVEALAAIKTHKMLVLLNCCHAGGIPQYTEAIELPMDTEAFLQNQNKVILTANHENRVVIISKPINFFTYALMEAFVGKCLVEQNKTVQLFDFAMYVHERVRGLSRNQQNPQLQTLRDSATQNFVIVDYPEGLPSIPRTLVPSVLTATNLGENKTFEIDTENDDFAPKKDTKYRQNFEWLMENKVKVDGNNNVVKVTTINAKNVTFNLGASNEELIKSPQDKAAQETGERLENLASTSKMTSEDFKVESDCKKAFGVEGEDEKDAKMYSVRHNIPEKMLIKKTYKCSISFDKVNSPETSSELLTYFIVKDGIKVEDQMKVTFEKSKHFEIKPIQVTSNSGTEFNFDITPHKLGSYDLNFTVEISPNSDRERTLEKPLKVKVVVVDEGAKAICYHFDLSFKIYVVDYQYFTKS